MATAATTSKEISYKPHKIQCQFHKSKARWRLLVMGRQSGKTYSAAWEAFFIASSMPNGRGWILGPTSNLTDIAWNSFLKILEKIPGSIKDHNKTKNIITLYNGHVILKKSAHNDDSLVGDTLDWIWIDEAALIQQSAWEKTLPTLLVKQGRVIFTTTPRGKNWIYDIYLRCLDENEKDYEYFHCTSYDNPHIQNEEIENLKKGFTADKIREEIYAEFLDGSSAVFNNVRKVAKGIFEKYNSKKKYVMGVDLAKHHDFTVITVMDKDSGNVVNWKRFTGTEYDKQVKIIVELAKRYDASVLMDATGVGDPIFDAVKKQWRDTEGLKFNNKNKEQMIENLIIKIERSEITIPDFNRDEDRYKAARQIVHELEAYELEKTASGNTRYNAPNREGFYDDCVISLALAAWKMSRKRFKAKST